jgi:hypothetical protein
LFDGDTALKSVRANYPFEGSSLQLIAEGILDLDYAACWPI